MRYTYARQALRYSHHLRVTWVRPHMFTDLRSQESLAHLGAEPQLHVVQPAQPRAHCERDAAADSAQQQRQRIGRHETSKPAWRG
jgi:hypothetical protein